jgi:zinc and cadmium transporter
MYYLLLLYCGLIVLGSLLGGLLPSRIKLTHQRIQLILSLVSGVMLGVALLHLLPHAVMQFDNNPTPAMVACLIGLLFMFFMVRMFHFHQHDLAVESDHDHKKKELCDDELDHHHVHCDHHSGNVDMSWIGLCFGLSVHTLVDGFALGAAVSSAGSSLLGLGTFLAIVLHKPLDAMSITSLMAVRGWDANKQLIVNLVFALMCPLGALLFTIGFSQAGEYQSMVLGYSLAFSAGIFLCISLGDLLPEVHFHAHDRFKLSAMLLLGVVIAFAIENNPWHKHAPKNMEPSPAVEESTLQDSSVQDFEASRSDG